ncbi:MAG: DUF4124 domain-containing protein [Gammaproteobacteria bacterium]|nr:DUF4124 domain-containing protein [Gammaproteobacteria bacterium]
MKSITSTNILLLESRQSTMLNSMNKIILFLSCFFMVSVMAADVYMTVDENGNPTFTDQPVEGSKKIEVKEVITIPALKNVPPPRTTSQPQVRYRQIAITNPKQDETYFRSEGDLVISVMSSPRLRVGDRYVYRLDGEEIYIGRATSQSISELDRGTHTVQIAILGRDDMEIIASETITFYMRHSSVLNRSP